MTDISRESIQPEEDELTKKISSIHKASMVTVSGQVVDYILKGEKDELAEMFWNMAQAMTELVITEFATHSEKQELRARIDELKRRVIGGTSFSVDDDWDLILATGVVAEYDTERISELEAQLTALEGDKDGN